MLRTRWSPKCVSLVKNTFTEPNHVPEHAYSRIKERTIVTTIEPTIPMAFE